MMCPGETSWIRLAGGELPEAERQAMIAHLTDCADCRQRWEAVQAVYGELGEWTVTPPERDLTAGVMAEVVLDRPGAWNWPAWGWQRLAAAVLLAAGAGVAAGILVPFTEPQQVLAEPPMQELVEAWGLDAVAAPAIGVSEVVVGPESPEMEEES